MFFWLREVAGWMLGVVGVYLIWLGVGEVQLPPDADPRTIEGAVLGLMGVFVLRMGVQLVRVSTAARLVMVPRTPKSKQ